MPVIHRSAERPKAAQVSRRSGGPQAEPVDGCEFASAARVAIGELLAAGVRAPTAEQILRFAGRHRLPRGYRGYRLPMRLRLTAGIAVFFRFFVLDDRWLFVGANVAVRRRRFDLVFESSDGEVLADEVEADRIETADHRKAADERLRLDLAAGTATYGGRFVGVRQLWLGAPAASSWVRPDGSREALTWESC